MPTVADLIRQLDGLIPLAKAGGWDAVGLQVGDRSAPVASVVVCHEVTDDVVTALEADPVDLLIAYHPLLFRSATTFVAGRSAAGRAFRLARAGIALCVVHTAFDVARGGTADALAAAIGIEAATGFGPNWGPESVKIVTFAPEAHVDAISAAMAASGAGMVGQYSACSYRTAGYGAFTASEHATPVVGARETPSLEPETRLEMVAPAAAADRVVEALVAAHPYEEPAYDVYDVRANAGFIGRIGPVAATTVGDLAGHAGAALGCVPRIAGAPGRRVERVAVVPGSGGSFVAAAAAADVLVTGDVSHHQARDALDRDLAVIDVGHIPSERPGIARLYAAIAHLGLPVQRAPDLDPDPWS